MTTNLEKRIAELERVIKRSGESAVWIDGSDATVRVDLRQRRGQTVTFPTVCEARVWIEQQLDTHAGGVVMYHVHNVADLYERPEELKSIIRDIIPNGLYVPDLKPTIKDGKIVYVEKTGAENHPQTFTADSIPGSVFGGVEPGKRADVRLWCLANLIGEYFDTPEFRERWPNLTLDDAKMTAVCFALFHWERPDAAEDGYAQLFYQVVDVEPLRAA